MSIKLFVTFQWPVRLVTEAKRRGYICPVLKELRW